MTKKSSLSKIILFLIVFVLTFAASTSIYSTIIKFRNFPFPYDSAGHAYEGLRIAEDIKAFDIISFVSDTYSQAFWPFFHSWLLAPAFILFGYTYTVARSVSLFCFIFFILTIYGIGTQMSDRHGHWIGIITVCLALTSLPFLVLSAMSMSEIPGLLMTFLTFLIYLKALKQKKTYLFFCTSILMVLTFFTKWHHGVFVIAAIFLTQIIQSKRLWSRDNANLLFPFLSMAAIWFVYPRHILSFYHHSTFQPHFYKFLSIENWLFYPKSLLQVYHASPIIAIIVLLCFFYSLTRVNEPQIMLFVIHVLVGITLMTIKLDNRHRYIISVVPSMWILASTQLVDIFHRFRYKISRNKLTLASTLVITFAFFLITSLSVAKIYRKYPQSLVKYNYYCDDRLNKAYDFISENVAIHNHIAVFGTWDYYNSLKSATIKWNIAVAKQNDPTVKNDKKRKSKLYFSQFLKNKDLKSYREFISFMENKDLRIYEYHLLSFMKILDPKSYQNYRIKTKMNPFSDKITDPDSLSRRITCLITIYSEREAGLVNFAKKYMFKQDLWAEYKKKKFSDLGITIIIYKRKVGNITAQQRNIRI